MNRNHDDKYPRIMIVDDDPHVRALMEAILADEPLSVRSCASGHEALMVAPEFVPEVVLLDMVMPGLDGFATLSAIQDLPVPPHKVLAVTGIGDGHLHERLSSAGIDVLAKPFEPDELKRRVDSVVERLANHEHV